MITKKRQSGLLAKAQNDVLQALSGPAYEAVVYADGDVDVEPRPSWELCTALCQMSDLKPATPRNAEEETFYVEGKAQALQWLLYEICKKVDTWARENAHLRAEIGRVVMEAHAFRSKGGIALQERRLDELPSAVSDLMREELQKNGYDYEAAARAVYTKALSVYRNSHPKVRGITNARRGLADKLGVSFTTVKRYTETAR